MAYLKLTLITLITASLWGGFIVFTAFRGWWMSPIAEAGDTGGFLTEALQLIESENAGNLAFVLIEEGQVVAEHYFSQGGTVNSETVFATASMSKWLAAHGVMQLVQEGQIELDRPVDDYLTRWNLPRSEFDNSEVTVRRLLGHIAGLKDGLGFGDYLSDEVLPTLESSLRNPRASSGKAVEIVVTAEPGGGFNYSGGGYLILELLIEERTGMNFAQYMEENIFAPLGMHRSSYDYLGNIDNNAGSYERDGAPAPLYKYASNAATAFNTSAGDLVKFVRAQLPATAGPRLLEREVSALMRQPHGRIMGADIWGLGTILYAPSEERDFVYGHDGGNEPAINSSARINPVNSDAFIVLETGHPSLATDLGSHWVLWQTGIPDMLNSSAVLESMPGPFLIGLLLILLLAARQCYHLRRSQRDA